MRLGWAGPPPAAPSSPAVSCERSMGALHVNKYFNGDFHLPNSPSQSDGQSIACLACGCLMYASWRTLYSSRNGLYYSIHQLPSLHPESAITPSQSLLISSAVALPKPCIAIPLLRTLRCFMSAPRVLAPDTCCGALGDLTWQCTVQLEPKSKRVRYDVPRRGCNLAADSRLCFFSSVFVFH